MDYTGSLTCVGYVSILVRVYTCPHTKVGHTDGESAQHFWLRKTHKCVSSPDGVKFNLPPLDRGESDAPAIEPIIIIIIIIIKHSLYIAQFPINMSGLNAPPVTPLYRMWATFAVRVTSLDSVLQTRYTCIHFKALLWQQTAARVCYGIEIMLAMRPLQCLHITWMQMTLWTDVTFVCFIA